MWLAGVRQFLPVLDSQRLCLAGSCRSTKLLADRYAHNNALVVATQVPSAKWKRGHNAKESQTPNAVLAAPSSTACIGYTGLALSQGPGRSSM